MYVDEKWTEKLIKFTISFFDLLLHFCLSGSESGHNGKSDILQDI